MRCCVDLIKFILFIVNFLFFLGFCCLLGGTFYVLFRGEDTFIGQHIQPNFDDTNPRNKAYFVLIIISFLLLSFLSLLTCLGCSGTACKSVCMLGSFIVILFVLFGGAVGALIFIHKESGPQAVDDILDKGLTLSLPTYGASDNDNVLTYRLWNWLQPTFQCCGVKSFENWARVKGVKDDCQEPKEKCVVPRSCCINDTECMYEPTPANTFSVGCAGKILPYVKILFYGIPSIMLVSLVFAFIVSASVSSAERRRKAARRGEEPGFNSQYSIGAADDFHHTSYNDNPPYNPQYETEMPFYGGGNVINYPTGTVPPPTSHVPLLHQAPPSYNEAVLRRK